MRIYKTEDKQKYISLFLIADEQLNMIEKYLPDSAVYLLDDNGIKGEITVLDCGNGVLEIKNLAVLPEYRRLGYGRKLIEFICEKYRDNFTTVTVGTGDSPLTVPFYEKCGFVKSHTVKNFFTDNYDREIIEAGVKLIDMVYLIKKL